LQDPSIVSVTIPSACHGVRTRYFVFAWLILPFYSPGLESLLTKFGEEWAWYWWDIAGAYYMYAFLTVAALIMMAGARDFPVRACFGRPVAGQDIGGAMSLTLFLFVASIALAYLLFYPLSFLLPDFVQWWYLDLPRWIYFDEDGFAPLPNLLMLIFMCGIAPFFEEFVFRGVMLPRWAGKFGVNRALLGTSAVFAVVHTDPLGAFLFAVCMGVLYLRTQSLWLPILCHAVNNLLAWGVGLVDALIHEPYEPYTIEYFRDSWIWGVGSGLLAIAWVVIYFKRARRDVAWRFPVA
jgi:membrane protease YdiL (CAAX protease family)